MWLEALETVLGVLEICQGLILETILTTTLPLGLGMLMRTTVGLYTLIYHNVQRLITLVSKM